MDVSIAYQGGGAKVLELMAAAKGCVEVESKRKDFKVIRVSGASAGAIAAAMHATGCDIDAIAAKSETLKKLVASRFDPRRLKRWRIAYRLAWGNSIFDEEDLHAVILQLFSLGGVDASRPIRNLVCKDMELRILRSDIHSHEPLTATETSDTLLIDALVDSCAIPFAFRVPRPGTNAHLLDGGLFQNLPAREALKGLKPGQEALGISFQSNPGTRVEHASLGRYAAAILESLLNERLRDATTQIKEANIIPLPNKRGTFNFADIFEGDFFKKFRDGVEGFTIAVARWIQDTKVYNEPDWFSDHPTDIAEQARRTNEEILSFLHKTGDYKFKAEFIHHEVFFNSSLDKNLPDIYNLHTRLTGNDNPGLQFIRSWFYASPAGALKRATVVVKDAKGRRRTVMLLPIRHPAPERLRSVLICLDRPLQPGETITILKSEQSFQGMADYIRDGISEETLGLGPGKFAKELKITVHFPEAEKPRYVRDASPDIPAERRRIDEEDGRQLPTKTKRHAGTQPGWISEVSIAKPKTISDEPLFIKVVYDKGSG
ncbi:MAG TPA: patatin-like phospholipase family protein [Allosphingosinicella sp.]|jgi:predicted acylesterase/phospholipase RssA|nr:patatin-like phospholipase family protein [Allosphingosinicella sp.]